MRQMNDDLIVRIAVITSTFLGIWMGLTQLIVQNGTKAEQLCIGDFSDSSMTMDWQEMTKPKVTDLAR